MLHLNEHLSEFSYGYGVTRETETLLEDIGVHSVPFLPSLLNEATLGFDVAFDRPGAVLMLQFKLGQALDRFRRRPHNATIPLLSRPFWRFKVDTSDPDGQFSTLLAAEANGAEAYYVAPCFTHWSEYAEAFDTHTILDQSHLIAPSDIRNGAVASPSPNGVHHIAYDEHRRYVCSDPIPIDAVSTEQLQASMLQQIEEGPALYSVLQRLLLDGPLDGIQKRESPVSVSERLRRRERLFGRAQEIAKTEADAVAAVVASEAWARGIQTIFVGSPHNPLTE